MMTRNRRTGFTLIELLVVIAIIAVLASLIAAAVFRALLIMPVKNTQLTILKLESTLHQQWDAVSAAAWNESPPPQAYQALLAHPLVNGDQNLAREGWIKLRLLQEFPQSFAQLNDPGQAAGMPGILPPLASYVQAIQGQNVPPQLESSVCLYLALSINRGVEFDPETMGPNEVKTVPGTNLKYFIDAWGEPLTFKNGLPTRPGVTPKASIASAGPDKQAGNVDDISSDQLKMGDY